MWYEAGQCNETSTPYGVFILTPSLEEWTTKAKESTFLAGHHPSISMSLGN